MKLTDKILKMKQDMSDFDKEVLTKLREIDEVLSVERDENLYDGHISDLNIKDDRVELEITYESSYHDYLDYEGATIPLCYFDITKEELAVKSKDVAKEKNKQYTIKMYNKKLEEIEDMKAQLNVLKAEIVATQEEAEELKRLSEKE